MGLLDTFGRQYRALWGHLSAGHKLILALLGLLSIGALVGVVLWAGAPEYEILYTGLSSKESMALIASLKEAGVPVRVAQGGTAVMVPAGKREQARMAAAQKGLPNSVSAGFDAFRDPKIGMTPFAERVNYIAALQNELAATITSLRSVAQARVHLAVPRRSIFKDDGRRASASVMLVTVGGQRLTREQAIGITNLVASAVEGLSAADVTITDARGNVIAGGSGDAEQMAADDQFAYRQKVEAYLSGKAESMLARVLGGGGCEVRVSAELDFENVKETKRTYDPDKRVMVSEKIESTKSSGSSATLGGAAGASGNVPGQGQAGAAGAAPSRESKMENIDTRYLVSESVQETVNRGAKIKRLTVAAFLDLTTLLPEEAAGGAAAAGKGAAGGAKKGPVALTVLDVEQVIKDAVGFDESRGDSIRIVEATFRPAAAALAGGAGGLPLWGQPVARYVAVAMVGLVLLVVARRVLKGIEAAMPRRVVIPEVMGMAGQEGAGAQGGRDELMRREISRFVESDPEAAGRMLEGWVEGEE